MGTQKGDGEELHQNLRFQTEGDGKRLFKEEGLTEEGLLVHIQYATLNVSRYKQSWKVPTHVGKISIRLSILTST